MISLTWELRKGQRERAAGKRVGFFFCFFFSQLFISVLGLAFPLFSCQYLESTQAPGIFLFALCMPPHLLSALRRRYLWPPCAQYPLSSGTAGWDVSWHLYLTAIKFQVPFFPRVPPSHSTFSLTAADISREVPDVLSLEGEKGSMPGSSALCLLLILISCATCAQKTLSFCVYSVVSLHC